jgi:hypothetical protein
VPQGVGEDRGAEPAGSAGHEGLVEVLAEASKSRECLRFEVRWDRRRPESAADHRLLCHDAELGAGDRGDGRGGAVEELPAVESEARCDVGGDDAVPRTSRRRESIADMPVTKSLSLACCSNISVNGATWARKPATPRSRSLRPVSLSRSNPLRAEATPSAACVCPTRRGIVGRWCQAHQPSREAQHNHRPREQCHRTRRGARPWGSFRSVAESSAPSELALASGGVRTLCRSGSAGPRDADPYDPVAGLAYAHQTVCPEPLKHACNVRTQLPSSGGGIRTRDLRVMSPRLRHG